MDAKEISFGIVAAVTVAGAFYLWTWVGCALVDSCWNGLTISISEYQR